MRNAVLRGSILLWGCLVAPLALADDAAGWPAPVKFDRNILSSPTLGPVPGNFANWRELFVEQARLNRAAADIESDPAAAEQLGGIVADPTTRRLEVYWKGEPNEATRARFANLSSDVHLELRPSEFSRAELRVAARKLVDDPRVVNAAPRADGSGISVRTDSVSIEYAEAELLRELRAAAAPQLANRMPVELSYALRPMQISTRDAVTSPAFAGARFWDSEGHEACTLGFAVSRRSNYAKGWLTAHHCMRNNFTYYKEFVSTDPNKNDEPGSFVLGTRQWVDIDRDLAFIVARSGVTPAAFVYVGKSYGEDAAVPVGDYGHSYKGNYVFASGSSTGLTGALYVEDADVVSKESVYNLVYAVHTQGGIAAGGGDSGGPVFAFMPDGRAEARGVTVMNDGPQNHIGCESGSRAQYRRMACTTGVYYVDVDELPIQFTVLRGDWP